ncbi:dynamin family protein [Desulforegula conservatrix]|uniref:dynamin family protein n=1 Tax=Desulforegula conservatrix TaxID=153026 RepID=UPI0003F835E0|nr:dynamin family protein [Desulforegula conservatrix]
MKTYHGVKEEILAITETLISLLETVSEYQISSTVPTAWMDTCLLLRRHLNEEIFRVAVVGTIKSGKSTFINSLFGADYLKRGAGVITSLVTRMKSSKEGVLKATVFFKNWEEINSEMKYSMNLFPAGILDDIRESFDIRSESNRNELRKALGALDSERLITGDTRNVNAVYLNSYLSGFDKVKDVIFDQDPVIVYKEDAFHDHRQFTGNEVLAVYVRDVELEIGSPGLELQPGIEIADCQGSDSPNPIHLAQVQDYLNQAHMLVYVISSRTGLRQGDIRFLNIIKKMGLSESSVFVVNADFSEHEGINDLKAIVDRTSEDLALINSEPSVFTVSALHNLFSENPRGLSEKDRMRLSQWDMENELVEFSRAQTREFFDFFQASLTSGRYGLLLNNHLDRLRGVTGSLAGWTEVIRDVLSRDSSGVSKMVANINLHKEKMGRISGLVRSTLDGAIQKLRKDLKSSAEGFMSEGHGGLLYEIRDYINSYSISFEEYEDRLALTTFQNVLHVAYQEFKQKLDTFMTEQINPRIMNYVREKESEIAAYLLAAVQPYDVMIQDALSEYESAMAGLGLKLPVQMKSHLTAPDMDSIKSISGIKLPSAVALIRYSVKVKTEASARFGFYRSLTMIRNFFKKEKETSKDKDYFRALKGALSSLKKETDENVSFHFKSYKENLKFQYLLKLSDVIADSIENEISARFMSYADGLSKIDEVMGETIADREKIRELLEGSGNEALDIVKRIDALSESLDDKFFAALEA